MTRDQDAGSTDGWAVDDYRYGRVTKPVGAAPAAKKGWGIYEMVFSRQGAEHAKEKTRKIMVRQASLREVFFGWIMGIPDRLVARSRTAF